MCPGLTSPGGKMDEVPAETVVVRNPPTFPSSSSSSSPSTAPAPSSTPSAHAIHALCRVFSPKVRSTHWPSATPSFPLRTCTFAYGRCRASSYVTQYAHVANIDRSVDRSRAAERSTRASAWTTCTISTTACGCTRPPVMRRPRRSPRTDDQCVRQGGAIPNQLPHHFFWSFGQRDTSSPPAAISTPPPPSASTALAFAPAHVLLQRSRWTTGDRKLPQ